MGNYDGKRPVRQDSPFREWVSDNLRYIILIAVIAAAVLVMLAVLGVFGKSGKEEAIQTEEASAAGPVELPVKSGVTVTEAPEKEAEATEEPTPTPSAAPAAETRENTLKPADSDVSDVIERYFAALSAADAAGVMAVTESITDSDIAAITNGAYMRDYADIDCRTCPGENDDEAVALVSYTYTYPGYANRIPALTVLYIIRDGEGNPRIASESTEARKQAAIGRALSDADVIELRNRISAQYDEVLASDPELSAYISSLG